MKYFVSMTGRGVLGRLQRCGVLPGAVRVLAVPAEVTSVLEELVREGQRTGVLTTAICAALGELLAERSGVLNLGVEGMMLVGAVMGSTQQNAPPAGA